MGPETVACAGYCEWEGRGEVFNSPNKVQIKRDVKSRVLQHFRHKASVMSVHAEASVHSADWLKSEILYQFYHQFHYGISICGLGVCLARRRSWVQSGSEKMHFSREYSYISHHFLCISLCQKSKFPSKLSNFPRISLPDYLFFSHHGFN